MLRLIADENVNKAIITGLRRLLPDIVLATEIGLVQTDDRLILEWAAGDHRVLVTHDVRTMPGYAYERVTAGLPLPGVFVVPSLLPIGRAIDDLMLMITCADDREWENRVLFLSL
ncbi:MAG: DUF5615 family PIN-like protein [Dehalococcoidia bacterium]